MAIFQVATNTPPKSVIITDWLNRQEWLESPGDDVDVIGSFHLDDPEGKVGMQVFITQAGTDLVQVALTYRDAPNASAEDHFIATMEHSVLGTRYIYDGLGDERFVSVYAGVVAAGYGQALGFAKHEGRWHVVPDELCIQSTGRISSRVAVDGFSRTDGMDGEVHFMNDTMSFTYYRRPRLGTPTVGLTASWHDQTTHALLAEQRPTSI